MSCRLNTTLTVTNASADVREGSWSTRTRVLTVRYAFQPPQKPSGHFKVSHGEFTGVDVRFVPYVRLLYPGPRVREGKRREAVRVEH